MVSRWFCQYELAILPLGSVGMQSNGRRTVPRSVRIARARKGGLARKRALTRSERQAIAREGALARKQRLTKRELSEAGRKAVLARWAKA